MTGHKAVLLMPGEYEVVAKWDGKEVKKTVTIQSEKTAVLAFP